MPPKSKPKSDALDAAAKEIFMREKALEYVLQGLNSDDTVAVLDHLSSCPVEQVRKRARCWTLCDWDKILKCLIGASDSIGVEDDTLNVDIYRTAKSPLKDFLPPDEKLKYVERFLGKDEFPGEYGYPRVLVLEIPIDAMRDQLEEMVDPLLKRWKDMPPRERIDKDFADFFCREHREASTTKKLGMLNEAIQMFLYGEVRFARKDKIEDDLVWRSDD
jgi:hypothetical protein